MVIKEKMPLLMYLILILALMAMSQTLSEVVHRHKRACPSGYSTCGWGCCLSGTSCGYGYYPCGNTCCGTIKCPSGQYACATTANHCCVSKCPANTLNCNADLNQYGGSYCCPSGTGCCPPTYSGAGGLCCSSSCPSGYYTCGWGCCQIGTVCGYGYYPCGNACCGPVKCLSGKSACASGSDHCCRISCASGSITCNSGTNTYCCPSNNYCCNTYNSNYGGTYGACCASSPSCGFLNQPCCANRNSNQAYTTLCNVGKCTNGYCII